MKKTVLHASVSENTVKLRARLTGDFPGSPVELDFMFMLAHTKSPLWKFNDRCKLSIFC